jgi:hypothetical protein
MAYNNPKGKIVLRAILLLRFIWRFQIIGRGMQRIKRSPRKDRKPLQNPMVVSEFLAQCPCWFLFQKYETGVHSNVLARKDPTVHRNV